MRLRLLIVSVALMGLAVLLAPDSRRGDAARAGEESAAVAPTSDTRVGRVQGTDAFIAVTHDGGQLRAYACDGSARRPATLARWFDARWDGREPVTVVSDGVELRVERLHADGRISGRLDGHRFTADQATGKAGLVDRDPGTWIRLADGSVRGVMIDPRPRKCRPVQVTLADGTTQIVTVCKTG
jgi:hypothetical protein